LFWNTYVCRVLRATDIKSWQTSVEAWISIQLLASSKPVFFYDTVTPDTNINLTKLIYIRTEVNYGQLRNSTSCKNRSRRIFESQQDLCHKVTNWNKQPNGAFYGQVGYKTRGNKPGLFIDYTFISQPVALKSIGKCITSYAYYGYPQTGAHEMLVARNIFFPYYKLWGFKTGLDDGREFGSR
jgi:hypothetical protein